MVALKPKWTLKDAVDLCRKIESFAPTFGCHVALTGGALYKDGLRKDCDLLFYRIRQEPRIDWTGLTDALRHLGVHVVGGFGWCRKAVYEGKLLDLFDPDGAGEHSSGAGLGDD